MFILILPFLFMTITYNSVSRATGATGAASGGRGGDWLAPNAILWDDDVPILWDDDAVILYDGGA
jgi:hypothetical protein